MKRVEAFIFDFDGVIADTETQWFETLLAFVRRHNLEIPPEIMERCVGDGDTRIMDLLAGALGSRNRLDTLYPELREEFAHRTEDLSARDGLADYLDFASHHGIRLACASSSFQTYIRRWLTGLGLLSRFDAVVTRNDVPEGRIKPWPDIYREALRRLSLPPVAAIAFEDSAVGAAAAEAAGLVCVLVPNRATERRVARCPNYKLNMVQTPPARLLQALELEMP